MWLSAIVAVVAAHAANPPTVITDPPDARGVCHLHGVLAPGAEVAVLCSIAHREAMPLVAVVETGSLDVQGWVLRSNDGTALVALRNLGHAPASLDAARVSLLRASPATPDPGPQTVYERCMRQAILERGDVAMCDQWKDSTSRPLPPPAGDLSAAD